MNNTNPFDDSHDDGRATDKTAYNNSGKISSHHDSRNAAGNDDLMSFLNAEVDATIDPTGPKMRLCNSEIVSPLRLSPTLFPPNLSSWTVDSPPTLSCTFNAELDADDEGSFHDCMSKIDTMEDEEIQTHNQNNADASMDTTIAIPKVRFFDLVGSEMQHDIKSSSSIGERTSLLPKQSQLHHDTHMEHLYSSLDTTPLSGITGNYNVTSSTPIIKNRSTQYKGRVDQTTTSATSSSMYKERVNGIDFRAKSNFEKVTIGTTTTASANYKDSTNFDRSSSMVSPLKEALTTWLSPYAQSAKRAGRTLFFSTEEVVENNGNIFREQETLISHGRGAGTSSCSGIKRNEGSEILQSCYEYFDEEENSTRETLYDKSNPSRANGNNNYGTQDIGEAVDITPKQQDRMQTQNQGERSSSERFLHKVYSSPALMTTFSNDKNWSMDDEERMPHRSGSGMASSRSSPLGKTRRGTNSSIVLKDIDTQGETNYSEDGVHPWTKLILLEELGTASSWVVLLLPYVILILAIILDGDSQLKNIQLGPLRGTRNCADIAQNPVTTPYGVSAKGYFPVPFTVADIHKNSSDFSPCNYPYELREGVGLLSNGFSRGTNLTLLSSSRSSTVSERSSIVDARYRYLMSHGYAFTSGLISHVPATSQSLQGFATFKNLSNRAVSLVARGSVLVSAIVFQRQTLAKNNDSEDLGSPAGNTTIDDVRNVTDNEIKSAEWSPVLILSPKKLNFVCKLNQAKATKMASDIIDGDYVSTTNPTSWDCTSHRFIDAFFSLPNTAVLIGGDLRVDVLLSHHKTQQPLSDDIWIDGRSNIMGMQDDYFLGDIGNYFYQTKAEKILSIADVSNPHELLAELSQKSVYMLEHESESYNTIVEVTRLVALAVTFFFLCYWCWSMRFESDGLDCGISSSNNATNATERGIRSFARELIQSVSRSWTRSDGQHTLFWWESPWIIFPERRYLLLLLVSLLMLQNPLLAYAFFHPSLYCSADFRCAADSLSGVSIHGILFFWLCLVNGLRYHTADFARRRFNQHRRVFELSHATKHIPPPDEIEDSQWARVRWYYTQYGDVDGGGAACSSALKLKHDIGSDSFVEFIFPKVMLLLIGIVSTITAAISRFPLSEMESMNPRTSAFLNPDQFGRGSKVYVISSVIQIIVIQIWGISIIYNAFITGERLRREPFLSTRPAQLAFRVLSAILLLGVGFSTSLFLIRTLSGASKHVSDGSGTEILYDTSLGSSGESLDSKADILFGILRHASTTIPYSDTSLNIGPGKILYATACSLVTAYIFLPSSHFRPSKKERMVAFEQTRDEKPLGQLGHSKQAMMRDRRLQGRDKRFVVDLARNTHTWRIFPLPIRAHGLMSQHTIKETLNFIGSFQLDGKFNQQLDHFGRGAIYKGRYIPIFCIEIACWLLEASWQAYYSATEYSLNQWAPGRMRLDSIGLKLERAIVDDTTDTHAFVASNISEQIEGEEDSIIVIAFRGTASMSNMKTDLNFRQVPLDEKIVSNVAAFNIRPGKPIFVEENAWNINDSTTQLIVRDMLCTSPRKYTSWPTTNTDSDNGPNIENVATENTSILLSSVSSGAKAIIRATPVARQALPCVHEGFLQNYSKVRKQIIEAILSVLKRQVDKSVNRCRHGENSDAHLTLPKIYITGHSMGGSLAQLLGLDLASNCEILIEQPCADDAKNRGHDRSLSITSQTSLDNGDGEWLGGHTTKRQNFIRLRPALCVYTYGQPRVGNAAFKKLYKQRVPHTFRVCTEGDAFTSMPTVGPCCGGIYRHAGLEVLLDEGCTGNILVGPTVVETLLRFTKVRTSLAAHSMERYRESLESALGRDELKEYYQGHGGKASQNARWHQAGNKDPLPSWVTSVKRSHGARY